MRVLVIDDHPLVSEAMGSMFRQIDTAIEIVACESAAAGLAKLRTLVSVDMVLLDLAMPEVNGMMILNDLRLEFPAVPVVIVSSTNDRDVVEKAIKRGASGFVYKGESREAMIRAFETVLRGEVYAPPRTMLSEAQKFDRLEVHAGRRARQVAALTEVQRANASRMGMTPREIDVLDRILAGDPNKQIAEVLCIAESTVKAHCTTVFRALNVTSRSQVISRVMQGVLDAKV